MLNGGIDSDRDVADQTLLDNASELEHLKLGVVAVRMRVLVDLKRIVPVASATPLVRDRVNVVRVDLLKKSNGDV